MHIVEARNITKIYSQGKAGREVTALADFSLTVTEGEIFGLLGPNGAGKTTFIKILLEIAYPTSGTIRLFGQAAGDPRLKARIGYLPENHKYPPYLTGEQVLRSFGNLSGFPKERLPARIDEMLQLVEMTQWRKMKIRKYSKGMMQRIGIAQALINDPQLIFLDEPTDGVDPIGRKYIRTVLTRLRDEGKTIFINSHLLSEVERISDRVAILNKGKSVRVGTVHELTINDHQWVLQVEGPLPSPLTMQWEATRQNIVPEGDTLIATVPDTAALNQLIDQLRAAQVRIVSIVQKKNSLEDMFIDLLSKEPA